MGERGHPDTAQAAALQPARPTPAQRAYLARGLDQPGGKLPLFDREGQRVDPRTIRACLRHGWAEPWFANPMKPDWLVCRLTAAGRRAVAQAEPPAR
jgi:hypothetical protein